MSPSGYYTQQFPLDLAILLDSLEKKGSCSRARAHQRQGFWGAQVTSTIANHEHLANACFSVGDLIVEPQHSLPDHLTELSKERQVDFLCSLHYQVLIDQVMYSHFKHEYWRFRELTHYPKVDRTIGWSRTLMMATPGEILSPEILRSRGLMLAEIEETLDDWARFIADDLPTFFAKHPAIGIEWSNVRAAMLADSACWYGPLGWRLLGYIHGATAPVEPTGAPSQRA